MDAAHWLIYAQVARAAHRDEEAAPPQENKPSVQTPRAAPAHEPMQIELPKSQGLGALLNLVLESMIKSKDNYCGTGARSAGASACPMKIKRGPSVPKKIMYRSRASSTVEAHQVH